MSWSVNLALREDVPAWVLAEQAPEWEVSETVHDGTPRRRRRTARTLVRLADLAGGLDDCDLSAGPDRP